MGPSLLSDGERRTKPILQRCVRCFNGAVAVERRRGRATSTSRMPRPSFNGAVAVERRRVGGGGGGGLMLKGFNGAVAVERRRGVAADRTAPSLGASFNGAVAVERRRVHFRRKFRHPSPVASMGPSLL